MARTSISEHLCLSSSQSQLSTTTSLESIALPGFAYIRDVSRLDDWLKFMNDHLWLQAWQTHIARISHIYVLEATNYDKTINTTHTYHAMPCLCAEKINRRKKSKMRAAGKETILIKIMMDAIVILWCVRCIPTYLSSAQSGQVWLKWNESQQILHSHAYIITYESRSAHSHLHRRHNW